MVPLPFHSYRLRSRKAAQTRLLNCYASMAPAEGKGPIIINGCAGIRSFATIAKFPQRAAIEFNGQLYCVAGNGFYHVSSLGAATLLGTVSGAGRVDMAVNTGQLAVLVAGLLYVYDGTNFTLVTDADFLSRRAGAMAVLDNYGGFIEPASGRFFIGDLNDFTTFDALDFATAEGLPDNLISIESNQRQFVLFGTKSIELWDNVGGSGFPFARIPNGFVENGCGAAGATCAVDNTVYWIDQDRIARRLEANIPRRVSTDGVEQRWQDFDTIEDAQCYSYVHDGHTFVVFRFPTAGETWVYDINTQEWHERQSYGVDDWRAAWVVKCYGKTLVGDTQSGNIGEIRSDVYSEWGDVLLREGTSGAVFDNGRWITHGCLELELDVGEGVETGQGSAPVIMLDVSDDGGVTFRARPSRSLGSLGQRKHRVRWHRNGRSRNRVYRWRVSDPVPFVVTSAKLDAL